MNPDHGTDPSASDASIHDLVQEILDRPADDPRRLELMRAIKRHDDALQELNATAESLDALRDTAPAPDLTAQILHAADRRRRFIPARVRRWVDRGRLATAAALLLVLGSLAAIDRVAPGLLDPSPEPRILADLPAAMQRDASQSAAFVRSRVEQAGRALAPVIEQPGWTDTDTDVPAAWVLQVVGADGSVYDTVMTFDPQARGDNALRVFRARRPEPQGITLLTLPSETGLVIEPDPESLP
ncbi:MAG: hypothetical protein RIB32_01880 [Phycisphaerales bacterium]